MSAEHAPARPFLTLALAAALTGASSRTAPVLDPSVSLHTYVVMVDAPDVARSADLAETAANDIVNAIGPAWRTSLTITGASSAADTAAACARATVCEIVRIQQLPSRQDPRQSVLRVISETARGDRHRPVNWQTPCGIRPTRHRAYSRCRVQFVADIAQEVRAHDDSQHPRTRRGS